MYPMGKSEEGQFLFSDTAYCGSNRCPFWKNKLITVQGLCSLFPSDLITITFLGAKQLSFKEKIEQLSRNPRNWWLGHLV